MKKFFLIAIFAMIAEATSVASVFAFSTQTPNAFANHPAMASLDQQERSLPESSTRVADPAPSAIESSVILNDEDETTRLVATEELALQATVVSRRSAMNTPTFPTLREFIPSVKNDRPELVAGVYVSNTLALRVVQQPGNNPNYISSVLGTATQFGLAAQYGSIGLLAHNYRSGALFFRLSTGQEVDLVYGDGTVQRYVVSMISRFQALSPDDPYSNFMSLDVGHSQLSSTELFQKIYAGSNKVVFQTCINADGNASWGRLFVTVSPIPAN